MFAACVYVYTKITTTATEIPVLARTIAYISVHNVSPTVPVGSPADHELHQHHIQMVVVSTVGSPSDNALRMHHHQIQILAQQQQQQQMARGSGQQLQPEGRIRRSVTNFQGSVSRTIGNCVFNSWMHL